MKMTGWNLRILILSMAHQKRKGKSDLIEPSQSHEGLEMYLWLLVPEFLSGNDMVHTKFGPMALSKKPIEKSVGGTCPLQSHILEVCRLHPNGQW